MTGVWFLALGLASLIFYRPLARWSAALNRRYAEWLLRQSDRSYRGWAISSGVLFSAIGLYLLLGGRGWW
jgi:hypothetical protein